MDERRHQQIARINELSALARTSWLVLLAFLAYIGITLLAVQDADFFVPSRQTELPLVGIAIPTFSFFVFAPPLSAALYIYLHIHLLKLFDALATAPARIDDEALGDRIHPWLVNDLFLTMRADGSASDRPLIRLSNFASLLLVWLAAPLVLAGFWWRSMPAHEEWLTLFLAFSLLIAIYSGLSSWWSARSAAKRVFRRPWPKPWHARWRRRAGFFTTLTIIALSWLRTEGGLDHYANRFIDLIEATLDINMFEDGVYPNGDLKPAEIVQEEWVASKAWIPKVGTFTLAQTDLAGVEFVALPEFWRSHGPARRAFRERWCHREGLSMSVCGHLPLVDRPPPITLGAERDNWCSRFPNVPVDDCLTRFDSFNERFEKDWKEERSAMLASLPKLDLTGRDLRNVDARGASLVNADLEKARLQEAQLEGARLEGALLEESLLQGANLLEAEMEGVELAGARLEGAILIKAQLEQANLRGAQLGKADLRDARMAGADLGSARFVSADLSWAQLEGARLTGAQLERADLKWARMEGADLSWARLKDADLRWARLNWTDLREAQLQGADLSWTQLQGANLRDVSLDWAALQYADLRGVQGLSQAQLDNVIGNVYTLLPVSPAPDTGEPYYIWSCWHEMPPNFEQLLGDQSGDLICGDSPRQQSGTTVPQGAPYPEDNPLFYSDQP